MSKTAFRLLSNASTVALFAALSVPNAAIAQDGAEQAGDTIVVTGSRILRDNTNSSSPMVTLGEEAIADTGELAIEAVLTTQPQFVVSQGSTSNRNNSQGGAAASVDLRGLGPRRTLVLMDGRRLPAGSIDNVVNLNVVPSSVIGRIEVLTGGASSTYGSDAISGVVNLIVRTDLDGIEADAQYGFSEEGDAEEFQGSLTFGGDFADGRGRTITSFEYFDRKPMLQGARDFYNLSNDSGSGPDGFVFWDPANLPSQAVSDAIFASYGLPAGSLPRNRFPGVNDDGTLFNTRNGFNFDRLGTAAGEGYFINDEGRLRYATGDSLFAVTPMERYTIFNRTSFEVSDNFEVYGQFMYSDASSRSRNNASGFNPPAPVPETPISVNHPGIPADLATLLASRPDPDAPIIWAKRAPEFGDLANGGGRETVSDFSSWQAIVGLTGDLGVSDWTYDVYASRDRFTIDSGLRGLRASRLQALFDSTDELGNLDGGASLCEGGYNPFVRAEAEAISQECVDFVVADAPSRTRLDQYIIEGTVQGAVAELPAGDLRFAATAGWRRNEGNFRVNPLVADGDILLADAARSTAGSTEVMEFGVEVLVPILSDVPFARSLDLSAAYRYSDYELSGGVSTYKAELAWQPIDDLLVRGGYARSIRAPNVAELFLSDAPEVARFGTAPEGGDPCDVDGNLLNPSLNSEAGQLQGLCTAMGVPAGFNFIPNVITGTSSGNPALTPETADTFTAGFVWTPTFGLGPIDRPSLSVDYYNIKLRDAIDPVNALDAIFKCHNVDGSNPSYDPNNQFCGLITRDATPGPGQGIITDIDAVFQNLGGIRTSGVEVQLNVPIMIGEGELTLSSSANFLFEYEQANFPGDPFTSLKGTVPDETRAFPSTKIVSGISWAMPDRYRVALRWSHIPSMANTNPNLPGAPESYNRFDMNVRYSLTENVSLRAGVNNITDEEPVQLFGDRGLTNGELYDLVGRNYYVGLNMSF